jgi:hypothetical protein
LEVRFEMSNATSYDASKKVLWSSALNARFRRNMSTLLKYLLSLAVHTMWMRSGKGGPVPRIPVPKGKKPVNLPVIGPWQMMLVTWLARKLWQRYGDDVKARVGKVDHPAARQIHDWIPTTRDTQSGNISATIHTPAGNSATPVAPATFNVPATPAAAATPSNDTRRLPRQTSGTKQHEIFVRFVVFAITQRFLAQMYGRIRLYSAGLEGNNIALHL